MSSELKPCPFCGGAATSSCTEHGSVVHCDNNECAISVAIEGDTLADAAAEWNCRAPRPEEEAPIAWAIYDEGSDELLEVTIVEPEGGRGAGIYAEPLFLRGQQRLAEWISPEPTPEMIAAVSTILQPYAAKLVWARMLRAALAGSLSPREPQPHTGEKS